jgi:hypothetical protein
VGHTARVNSSYTPLQTFGFTNVKTNKIRVVEHNPRRKAWRGVAWRGVEVDLRVSRVMPVVTVVVIILFPTKSNSLSLFYNAFKLRLWMNAQFLCN